MENGELAINLESVKAIHLMDEGTAYAPAESSRSLSRSKLKMCRARVIASCSFPLLAGDFDKHRDRSENRGFCVLDPLQQLAPVRLDDAGAVELFPILLHIMLCALAFGS